jgi:hypothetical protein
METLEMYRKVLYRLSEGDPIKLAAILQRDLLNDNPNAFQIFNEKINADSVIKVAQQIVNEFQKTNLKNQKNEVEISSY